MPEGMSDLDPLQSVATDRKPEREGLPAGYRMRADAHYVDQLTGRRNERIYSDHPRATPSHDADAVEPASRDRRGDRVLAQIAEEVSALEAASALLRSPVSTAAHRATVDLVHVHAKRAAWLAAANTLLDGTPRGSIAARRQVGALLMHVREGLETECRLAGVALQFQADDWNAWALVNEREFLTGVAGAVRAALAGLGDAESGAIRVTLAASDEALQTVEVAQDRVQMPAAASQRFFDLSWTDRPGGWMAALGAAAARALAQRDGGSAAFIPGERRGSTIRLTFATPD